MLQFAFKRVLHQIVIPSEAVHTCAEHLGECMTGCRAQNLARKATDCAEGETCCVLVV